MAILTVYELPRPKARKSSQGGSEYERRWVATVDGPGDTPKDVRDHATIPNLGDGHPEDEAAKVFDIDPRPVGEGRVVWHVTVQYTTKLGGGLAYDDPDTPSLDEAVINWSSYSVMELQEFDRDGKAIYTTANELFDPPPEVEKHFPIVSITRFEEDYNALRAFDFVDSVNDAAVTIAGYRASAGEALLTKYEGRKVILQGEIYWEVVYEVMFAVDWQKNLINQGFHFLDSAGKYQRIHIGNNAGFGPESKNPKSATAVRLNDSGKPIPDSTGAVVLNFDVYKETDFEELGLDVD